MTSRVTVAVIDSGVNVPHPHLPGVAGGVGIGLDGSLTDEYVDRLGHGTAVAAAIHEKAPDADLYAVRVFEETLATSVATLARAIDWASERGIRLVNLSLGTPNDFRASELAPAVGRAIERGTIIVSPREYEARLWFPGCMEGVAGVELDWDHPRDAISVRISEDGQPVFRASGFPRPIPGVPPERNLSGISFAAANVTGALAAALASAPEVRTASEAAARVPSVGRGDDLDARRISPSEDPS